ncbi:unnamed protein product [Cyprideis torosa]|uniref:Uncharacterized protein n=1 Tax=Cyprideis torosa TaxID=163714 RepID=A0A7R8ZKP0_9CRUS|nr:unnamed protein product [Cyprideis torosa]CAG0889836.1 unnamed protein product [Cyprideis torosa]
MTVSHCLLVRLIASAISCAKQAGIIIQDIHRSRQFMTVWKSFDDPQTEGDRASQRCIQGSLQKKFGSLIHIIGEEEDIRQRIRLVDQIRQVGEKFVSLLIRSGKWNELHIQPWQGSFRSSARPTGKMQSAIYTLHLEVPENCIMLGICVLH